MIANHLSGNVTLFLNDGNGGFIPEPSYSTFGVSPTDIVAGVLDSDVYVDLAVTHATSNSVTILLNDGNSPPGFSATVYVLPGSDYPVSLATIDLDGDSDLDLIVANRDSQNVTLLENVGSSFSIHAPIDIPGSPTSVCAADVDGDADNDGILAIQDVVGSSVCGATPADAVVVLENSGGWIFSVGSVTCIEPDRDPSSVSVANFDGYEDGDEDVDIVVAQSGTEFVDIFDNDGDGQFSLLSSVFLGGTAVAATSVAHTPTGAHEELNLSSETRPTDELPDVSAVSSAPGTLASRINRSTSKKRGLFARVTQESLNAQSDFELTDLGTIHDVVAGNLAGGADPDVVVISQQGCEVFTNDGIGSFTAPGIHSFRSGALDLSVIAHELSHGVVSRLTGGIFRPGGGASQASGLVEGWADAMSLQLTGPRDGDSPRGMFTFWSGHLPSGSGVRILPYSNDQSVNLWTFGDHELLISEDHAGPFGTGHAAGEIWAVTLWDLYWLLIGLYGQSGDLYAAFGSTLGGENVSLKLAIDALKFAPGNPATYVTHRNAYLLSPTNSGS